MKTSAMVTTKPALLPPRRDESAERNTDQHQDQASRRIGEALVQFDQVGFAAGALGVLVERAVAHGEDGGVIVADVGIFLGADGQRKFRLQKGRNLVLGAAVVVYDLRARCHSADASESDVGPLSATTASSAVVTLGSRRIAQVGEEDALPARDACAGADILHVEHIVLEVFVEDARLNLKRGLLIFKRVFQPQQRGGCLGGDVERVGQRYSPANNGDDRDHPDKKPDADAHRPHGGDLAVGSEAG